MKNMVNYTCKLKKYAGEIKVEFGHYINISTAYICTKSVDNIISRIKKELPDFEYFVNNEEGQNIYEFKRWTDIGETFKLYTQLSIY